MLDGVEAHILLFAGTQILPLLAAGTPQQYICLHSFFTRRSHPATFPHTPFFRCPLYRQQETCQPVSKRATRGRLRSFTHPNLDAHKTGRTRSRSRDSRRGEPPEAGSGVKTEGGAAYLHPDPPTKRVDSPVCDEKKTDQPSPDPGCLDASSRQPRGSATSCPPPRSTGHHRRHLGSPRSTERHPQSSRDRRAHAAPLNLAYAAARPRRRGPSGRSTTPTRR